MGCYKKKILDAFGDVKSLLEDGNIPSSWKHFWQLLMIPPAPHLQQDDQPLLSHLGKMDGQQ